MGINQYGYDLQEVWWNFYSISVPNGSGLYVTLGNAVEGQFGDPIYWDENSGPSTAYENTLGSIPSEAFTLTSVCCGPPIPEPSSIVLFGSGILGLGGVLRRWLF